MYVQRRRFRLQCFEEKNVLQALATSRSAEGRFFLMPHFVIETLAGFGDVFANVRSQKTVVSVLDAGPRGRVNLTQGETSTFILLCEVLALRDLFFGCNNRLVDTRSVVVAVSADLKKS